MPSKTSSHIQSERPSRSENVHRRRLKALHRYELLGSGSEPSFDRITRLAADLFDAPMAILRFIGRERQWVQSTVGVEMESIRLDGSFCLHAIESDGTTVIENCTQEERFQDCPLVTGDAGIQFYAGTPLSTPTGLRIGTLCVLDTEPRTPSSDQLDRLEDLAELAMTELELRRASEKHREVESEVCQQRNLLEHAQRLAAAWELDVRTAAMSGSRELYEILEVAPGAEIEFEDMIAFYAPAARPRIRQAFQQCVDEGNAFDLELPLVTATGTRRWVRTVGARTETDGAQGVTVAGAIQDITERKREEQHRRQVISRVTDAIVEVDSGWGITLVNDHAEELFGTTEEDLLGMHFWEVFEEDLDTRFEDVYRTVMRTREPAMFEEECPVLDGWTDIQVYPNNDGGISIYFEEVSDRRERERELRDRGRKLNQIRENVSEVIWMSPVGKTEIDFISKAYEDIWGRPTDEAKETPDSVVEAIHPDDRARVRSAKAHLSEAPEDYDETYRVVRPDGEVRWVRDRAAGVYDDDGQLQHVVGIATDITEQTRSRRELEHYRQYTDRLLDATDDLFMVFDETGTLERWNVPLSEIGGYSDEELEGTSAWSLVPESERARTRNVIMEGFQTGRFQLETHLLTKEGTPIPYEFTGNRVEHPDGELRLVSIGRDITERKEFERALKEERDLLDRILETSPAAIALFNREGEFVRASGRAETILGLDRDEVTDRTFNDPEWRITAPDGSPMPDEELPFSQVMSTGEPVYDVEHAIEWPDGRRRLLSVSGAPLYEADETLEGAVFHIEDITEQRRMEQALRQSEQRFRGVFENAGLGIALVDTDGLILEANPALESMLEYGADELQGKHFEEVTDPRDADTDKELYAELVDGQRDEYQLEKRYVRKNGDVFWGHLTVSRSAAPDGTDIVGVVEDIDEKKRNKRRLQKAKEEAERTNELKSAFLANMSHEIRTPLTSILGFAESIGGEVSDLDRGIEEIDLASLSRFARLIEKSGRRLMETLNGVLTLSKLEAGEMDFSTEKINLAAEVEEATAQVRPRCNGERLDLQVEAQGSVCARANEGALQIVLDNLLNNAIKYTTDGGQIWVRAYSTDQAAVLEVEDTGIGMDPAHTDELFEPFRQESEGPSREYEGTGLGLAVATQAVEQMGGAIDVETEKGEGSCFTIRLPRGTEDV